MKNVPIPRLLDLILPTYGFTASYVNGRLANGRRFPFLKACVTPQKLRLTSSSMTPRCRCSRGRGKKQFQTTKPLMAPARRLKPNAQRMRNVKRDHAPERQFTNALGATNHFVKKHMCHVCNTLFGRLRFPGGRHTRSPSLQKVRREQMHCLPITMSQHFGNMCLC